MQNFGASFRVTDSDYFVIEGDEYDTAYFDKKPKFMHYLPEIAIVNNIEFDHADIYATLQSQVSHFAADESGARQRAPDRRMGLRDTCAKWSTRWASKLYTLLETFGTCEEAKWQARDLDFSGELTQFSRLSRRRRVGRI